MTTIKLLILFIFLFPSSIFSQEEPILMLQTGGHRAWIKDIALTKDKKILVSASNDKTIKIWDIEKNKLIDEILGYSSQENVGKIFCMALSPDNKYLAVGGTTGPYDFYSFQNAGAIRIYDFNTKKILFRLIGHNSNLLELVFSKDSKYLFSSGFDNNIIMWNVKSGEKIREFVGHTKEIYGLDVFNNKLVSASVDGNVTLWDINSGENIKSIEHSSVPYVVKFSPDGSLIACGKWGDNQLIIYDNNLNEIQVIDNEVEALSLAFSPSGKKIFTGIGYKGNKVCNIYEIQNGIFNKIASFDGHNDLTLSAVFYDENTIISAGGDDFNIIMWNWDSLGTSKVINTFSGNGKPIYSIFADNSILAYSVTKKDEFGMSIPDFIFDFSTFQTKKVENPFSLISLFKPIVKVGEYELETSTIEDKYNHNHNVLKIKKNNSVISEINKNQFNGYRNNVFTFTQNRNILIGAHNGKLISYDILGNSLVDFLGHTEDVLGLAITMNGKRLISSSADQTIKFWNLEFAELNNFPSVLEIFTSEDWVEYLINNKLYDEAKLNDHNSWINIIQKLKSINDENYKSIYNVYLQALELFRISIQPIATLFISTDNEWIIWTPEGYYTCSVNGAKYVGWLVNQGLDRNSIFYSAEQLFSRFYRPDIIEKVLAENRSATEILNNIGEQTKSLISSLYGLPEIKIISPKNSEFFSAEESEIEVTLEIIINESGLSEFGLFHNNKRISDDKIIADNKSNNNVRTVTYNIELLPGENILDAFVKDKNGTDVFAENILIEQEELYAVSDLYMLIIGINEYENESLKLSFAKNDAIALESLLKFSAKSIYNNIYSTIILDKEATKENIVNSLNDISKNAKAKDVFIFFFAGHGIIIEENEDYDFYMIMKNVIQLYGKNENLIFNSISAGELKNYSSKIQARKQLFLIDACQSGGAINVFTENKIRGAAEQKAIWQLSKSAGIVVIAASGTQQFASEYFELGHGLFTYALIDGLKGNADSINDDGKITVKEIELYLDEIIPKLSTKYRGKNQRPNSFSRGQDFPITVK